MEVVGDIAAISQLFCYSFSVSKLLIQLVKDTETGPSAHRHKVEDIRLLELLIKDILKTPTGFLPVQDDMIIPIVIQISTTTCKIRALLHQIRTVPLVRVWTIFEKHSAISKEFITLDSKRQILSLCLAQDIRRRMSDSGYGGSEPSQDKYEEDTERNLRVQDGEEQDWQQQRRQEQEDMGSSGSKAQV